MNLGIDVSSAQNPENIDWAAVKKAGFSFVYVKATDGNNGIDPAFVKHVQGAKTAGMCVGAYHFALPLISDGGHPGRSPEEQAKIFLDAVQGADLDLAPALDLEWPPPQDWATRWSCSGGRIAKWGLDWLRQMPSVRAVLYTYPWFWASLKATDGYQAYDLWIADYALYPSEVPPPSAAPVKVLDPWSDWKMWQSGQVLVPGIPGKVDIDVTR